MKLQLTPLFFGIEDYMFPCVSKRILGFDCPGCGLQRSVVHLIKGEFAAAFEMYPAIYAILILFAFLLLNRFVNFRYSNQITIGLMISTVAMILINFALKFI